VQLAGVDAASIGMEDHGDPDDISFSQLVAGMKETYVMSIASNRLKEDIEKGARKRDVGGNTARAYDLCETVKKFLMMIEKVLLPMESIAMLELRTLRKIVSSVC